MAGHAYTAVEPSSQGTRSMMRAMAGEQRVRRGSPGLRSARHGNTTSASADLSTDPTFTDHLLCARSYFSGAPHMMAGAFRQRDTHTQDVLRALTHISTGRVCLGRLGWGHSGNGLKEAAFESVLK